ncbi:MAG: CooT family nickel-binding protein [Promethearchaeota archaeon]
MCLSKVYVKGESEAVLVMEETARIVVNDGGVEIFTLFGEKKRVDDCLIEEVNLMENSIFLKKILKRT